MDRRDTFVGTINYMSPEMIDNSVSVLESDLWALGCIIFKMVAGRVPFPGLQLYQVGPLISARDIAWPEQEMDAACRDVIDRLLQLDPKARLGAPDTEHDMQALMGHEFFEGIDFNSDLSQLNIKQLLDETKPQ